MDTFLFILMLILNLIFFNCKKETLVQTEEESKNYITGYFELYPSYFKKIIQFEKENQCFLYDKDQIMPCFYSIKENYLNIYLQEDKINGYFYFENPNQEVYKGYWEDEVRILRKINKQVEK